jgi:hypothetical protein
MTSPADVFSKLWTLAENDLALASAWPQMPHPDPRGTVIYHHLLGEETVGFGCYGPNRAENGYAAPVIQLWRTDALPDPQDKPDLETRPLLDACDLSHEHGHFLSDKNGKRTAAYEAALDQAWKQVGLTAEEHACMLDEEERAWTYARATLEKLGVDEWDTFNARKEEALDTYRSLPTSTAAP